MPEIKHFIYPPTGVEHCGEVIDSKQGFDVIECETCGFKHIVPIPTAHEMGKYYYEQFLRERPLYVDRFHEDLDWWKMVYAEKYEMLEEYLPSKCRRILDIGCGLGLFLQEGKERGWETLGIEPSQQAAEYARHLGLKIVEETFSRKHVEELGRFDVVHMHEVLEHVPNPTDQLQLVHRLLEPNGLLWVVVPNDYNPLQRALREQLGFKPWWVAPPVHINYFTFESLERLLCSLGFCVLLKTATFPMEVFLLMGDNYVGNDALGRTCHGRRKRFELNLKLGGLDALKRALYATLAEHGVGREIVMLAKQVEVNGTET